MSKIFDLEILKLRQQRAVNKFEQEKSSSPDFLLGHIAEDIGRRLDVVSRKFDNAIDLFGRTGAIADMMAKQKNITNVTRIETTGFYLDRPATTCMLTSPSTIDFGGEAVDLVISALALHWSNDLPTMLIQLKQAIRPDGLFLTVLPGPETLKELRACLAEAESEISGGISPRVDPFITVQTAGTLLQHAGFALPVIDTDKITVRYDTMFDLIDDLRAMAATNVLYSREKTRFSKTLFSRASKIYASRFADADGRIRATFELISMSGWVPHHSQQKPLKPGSASIGLAELLNPGKKPG